MSQISYAHHHFPPSVIQHGVWLYLRFCLSLRDLEDLLAERGLDLPHETVRRWVISVSRKGMRRVGASTTALRTHIKQCGDENGRGLASSSRAPPNDFPLRMPPS